MPRLLLNSGDHLIEGPVAKRFLRKDPLVVLGLIVLVGGIALTIYGLIPTSEANYVQVASGPVPLTDATGTFIYSPDIYFRAHHNGTAPIDNVQCSPSINGYICYGFQFIGTKIVYSISSRDYGFGLMVLGVIGIYGGNRLAPLKPKLPHLRPITIRIDEDVCVANGVCIGLAPNVFQLKKQETPTIFAPMVYIVDPTGADNDTIIEAAVMCPTAAIIIEDAETGERIHPPYPEN
ncbi:MAG: ferredoxin [Thaumarchaeota archaeon]|nr:ferredoxin [Nitrososphaerota archaeon]